MIRFGKISEIKASEGSARVAFKGDNTTSPLLPCLVRKSKSIKESFPFEVNEEVVCLMNPDMRTGVILGAIYNKSTLPTITDENEFGIDYGVKGKDVFNNTNGKRELIAIKTKVGSDADSLGALLTDLITQVSLATVINPETGTPLPLVNATAIAGFVARAQTFLE
jgi:hypothetical protein